MPDTSWILAIDFGTSYTVAAVRVGDRPPEVIEVRGERRVPSVVLVDPEVGLLVGRPADDLAVTHPGNALRAIKNRIGDQSPVILGGRPHQAVQLIAALLHDAYNEVLAQMGTPPREVRLTHPATWGVLRLNRLLEAASKAGLPNPVLVPEPVAAAFSFATEVGIEAGQHIAVYDLGGGTFDCAVVAARDGEFVIVGRPTGDQNLGGELFDEIVVNHVGEQLPADDWDRIQLGDEMVWQQVGVSLRNEVRRAKEALSSHPYVNVIVPLPNVGIWQTRLTRDQFDEMIGPYIDETIRLLQNCIDESGLQPADLAAVSLVGGSSRSPVVEQKVKAAFPMVTVSRRGDPKAAVAAGATRASGTVANPQPRGNAITHEASPGTAPQAVLLAPPVTTPPPPPPREPAAPTVHDTGGTPAEPLQPVTAEAPPSPPPRKKKTALLVGACLVAVALVVGGLLFLNRDGDDGDDETTTEGSETPTELVDFEGHSATVHSARFSPDGTTVLTSSDDGTAKLFDAGTGDEIATVSSDGPIRWATWSPDASLVATASDDTSARVYDSAVEYDLWDHEGAVNSVDFSPDGSKLVTASDDWTAKIWTSRSGSCPSSRRAAGCDTAELLATLEGHEARVRFAQFSPDGSRVLTASDDGKAKIWDASDGHELWVLEPNGGVMYTAEWSPDGSRVVTASEGGKAKIWDASNGEITALLEGHEGDVHSAVFSPDGSKVVTAGQDNTARLWDANSGEELYVLEGHEDTVWWATFNTSGSRVLTVSEDYNAKIWDTSTGDLVASLEGHDGPVVWGEFDHDGGKVVTASTDGTVIVWGI